MFESDQNIYLNIIIEYNQNKNKNLNPQNSVSQVPEYLLEYTIPLQHISRIENR